MSSTKNDTSCSHVLLYIKQAIFRLEHSSDEPTLILFEGPTQVHASTSHSYQTLVSSVWRHMLTSSSVSAGKYSGCYNLVSIDPRPGGCSGLTLRGKKIGNQEIISLLFWSIRSGWMLISTFSPFVSSTWDS
jgi:hypothetical protein